MSAAARLELDDGTGAIVRDADGNARGGIRTPLVDAPVATLRGDGNDAESFCRLFGTTLPFDAATLAARYPDHAAYLARFEASAAAAVADGFLLAEEVAHLVRAADRSDVPPG